MMVNSSYVEKVFNPALDSHGLLVKKKVMSPKSFRQQSSISLQNIVNKCPSYVYR